MLILGRHTGEEIVIGRDIRITVVSIHGDTVRLGIDADKAMPVHRREVAAAIERRNRGT